MDVRPLLTVLRASSRSRLAALRLARPSLRLAMTAGAIESGVLAALDQPRSADALADELDYSDRELLRAFLDTLTADGLLQCSDGRYRRTRRATGALTDRVARSTYQAFGDYHTGLYRELRGQLAGGQGRKDVTARAEVIAGLSEFMAPFVHREIERVVGAAPARRVLDLGCGTGHHLATMLEVASEAEGVGIELDPATAEAAQRDLRQRFGHRVEVRTGDVRSVLESEDGFDVALAANVIYYFAESERTALLSELGSRLTENGRLLIVTTALNDELFSRHFDLLLRAQQGDMGLPQLDVLQRQLGDAGLRVTGQKRLTPAEPLYAVLARR